MLANFIFHFAVAVLLVWGGVAWFLQRARLNALSGVLFSLLARDRENLLTNKSLIVRSVKLLEVELCLHFQKKVRIELGSLRQSDNILLLLRPLFALLAHAQRPAREFQIADENLSGFALADRLRQEKGARAVCFSPIDSDEQLWRVELKS